MRPKKSPFSDPNAQQITKLGRRKSPLVFSTLSPAIPTVVFDTYWRFAAERQNVFFSRFKGESAPWSSDPILNEYKFTNVYRASDRVSQFLIKNVIYDRPRDPQDVLFRILIFKLFNKIETWHLLEASLGEIAWSTYRYSDFDRVLSRAMGAGVTIYSAAYIMASAHRQFAVQRKHQSHLKLIELMFSEAVLERLLECRSMREAFELLRSYPLFGDFLAYQIVTDLNYSELLNFSEMDFTMPGPGARDGIRKCFKSFGGLSEVDIIRLMADRQEYEFSRLGIEFQSLWGRRIQLIDAQNIFCEVDKYSRVKHPEIAGLSGRIRIKQKYKPQGGAVNYFYPPKWNLRVPKNRNIEKISNLQNKLF